MKTFTDLLVGELVKIKQFGKSKEYLVKNQIAHSSNGDCFMLIDSEGEQYYLTVRDGIYRISYHICKWEDAPWGTAECKRVVGILEKIKKWWYK